MTEHPWPFDQPRNSACFTLRAIVFGAAPILHVSHDDDQEWQFLGIDDAREDDACLVALEEIVALDASVLKLANLPPGWHAWRASVTSPWQREPRGESEQLENERSS